MSKVYIVMYHYVRDLKNSRYPGIKGLDYELFKDQIAYFAKKFHVITMEEVINFYGGGVDKIRKIICLRIRYC